MKEEKIIIINAAYGGWYSKGSERLKRSLLGLGFTKFLNWVNQPINGLFDSKCPYTIKAAAFKQAADLGFTHILWLDASMWAVKNPMPLFELIDKEGIYCETNGYNAAQECSDKCLEYFSITRDKAEEIPMCSSGFMGINLESKIGKEFLKQFVNASIKGVFHGSRQHDNQSKDPRFLHHRQDQSAASLIMHKIGYKPHQLGTHFTYDAGGIKHDNLYFLCRGM